MTLHPTICSTFWKQNLTFVKLRLTAIYTKAAPH